MITEKDNSIERTKVFTDADRQMVKINRNTFYEFPCALCADEFDDVKMQKLAERIASHLRREYTERELAEMGTFDNYNDDAEYWEVVETSATRMGMRYCEDVEVEKEIRELLNTHRDRLDKRGYIQFEKSVSKRKETKRDYSYIDGLQLGKDGNKITAWVSDENSSRIWKVDFTKVEGGEYECIKEHLEKTLGTEI